VSFVPSSTSSTAVDPSVTTHPAVEQMLSGWPEVPDAVDLAEAEYVLPSLAIPATSVELSTIDLGTSSSDVSPYVQQFLVANGEMVVTIETLLGGVFDVPLTATLLYIPRWSSAFAITQGSEARLVLGDTAGVVTVRVAGEGETFESAIAIASSLVRRDAGQAGWNLELVNGGNPKLVNLVLSAESVSEGWRGPWAQRGTSWLSPDGGPVVEILVTVGRPELGSAEVSSAPSFVDGFAGGPAVGQVIPDRGSLVAWSPATGVTVTVATRGTIVETLEVANSLRVVSEQEWLDSGNLLPPRNELGCGYFFNSC